MQSSKCLSVFGALPQQTLQSASLVQVQGGHTHTSIIINQIKRNSSVSCNIKCNINCTVLVYFTNQNSRKRFLLL